MPDNPTAQIAPRWATATVGLSCPAAEPADQSIVLIVPRHGALNGACAYFRDDALTDLMRSHTDKPEDRPTLAERWHILGADDLFEHAPSSFEELVARAADHDESVLVLYRREPSPLPPIPPAAVHSAGYSAAVAASAGVRGNLSGPVHAAVEAVWALARRGGVA